LSFGNIFREPFPAIWNHANYEQFRNRFAEREKSFRDLYDALWDHSKIKDSRGKAAADPPVPCKTCHKILGV
jgi:hypothetical protein